MGTSTWQWTERSGIDPDRYNQAVTQRGRSIYAYSFYLDAVAKKWGAYIKGDYEDVYPVAYTDYFKLRQAYVPNFQGVSFFTHDPEDTHTFEQILKEYWRYYDLQILQQEGNGKGRNYQVLSLSAPPSYSTNAKRLIKKGTKEGLSICFEKDWQPVFDIFKRHTFTKIEGLQYSDLPYLEQLLKALHQQEKLFTAQILKAEKVVGGGFFIPSGNRIIYLKGAALPEVMKQGGMYQMMDTAIQQFTPDFDIFDFGGSAVSQVAEFNRKLGGQNKKTVSLQSKALPQWYKVLRKTYRTLKK